MTQFALVRVSKPIAGLVGLVQMNDHSNYDFLMEKAKNLFPEVDTRDVYVIDVDGQEIDELMVGAQTALIMQSFDETELCKFVEGLLPAVDELVFWYADYYDDLDEVHDAKQVLRRLEDAVNDSMCELYLRYKKKK